MNKESNENNSANDLAGRANSLVMLDDYRDEKFNVNYVLDDNKNIIGVSHPDWGFTITRNQDSKTETAIVCNDTDEPFGVLDSDVFNTILMCWLLIDDPRLIDEAVQDAT